MSQARDSFGPWRQPGRVPERSRMLAAPSTTIFSCPVGQMVVPNPAGGWMCVAGTPTATSGPPMTGGACPVGTMAVADPNGGWMCVAAIPTSQAQAQPTSTTPYVNQSSASGGGLYVPPTTTGVTPIAPAPIVAAVAAQNPGGTPAAGQPAQSASGNPCAPYPQLPDGTCQSPLAAAATAGSPGTTTTQAPVIPASTASPASTAAAATAALPPIPVFPPVVPTAPASNRATPVLVVGSLAVAAGAVGLIWRAI